MTVTRANLDQMNALVSRVRRDGVLVRFQAGWDRRDAGGLFGSWAGGVIHHDASTVRSGTWGALPIIVAGRGGANPVPGPLAQGQVARGNIPQVVIVTAGRGNHAGIGGPYLNIPRDSGNRWLVGWEVANNGVDEPYSDATLWTIECIGHAVYELTGHELLRLIGHNEWAATPSAHLDTRTSKATGRKSDPKYNMTWMRERIVRHQPPKSGEFTMDAEAEAAFAALKRQVSGAVELLGRGRVDDGRGGFKFDPAHANMALTTANLAISSPDPKKPGLAQRMGAMSAQLSKLETAFADLKTQGEQTARAVAELKALLTPPPQ